MQGSQSKNMTFKFILNLDWFFFFVLVLQRSFRFFEGKEPYEWVMEKMHAYSRSYKCEYILMVEVMMKQLAKGQNIYHLKHGPS